MSSNILQEIVEKFSHNFKTDVETLNRFSTDWTKHFTQRPKGVFFPSSTIELADFVKFANKKLLKLVPAGGLTGLSGGATAMNEDEIIVSFEQMNEIGEISKGDCSIMVQAGVITETLQKKVGSEGFFFPVDFGAKGSSTIGGNLATNVGGINVIRYGNIRNWVSGITVVTGKGDILELNKGLVKNATGYDLKNLFVGSEGTLGFITTAILQLTRPQKSTCSILLAIPEAKKLDKVLSLFKLKSNVIAAEFFTEEAVGYVIDYLNIPHPFSIASPYYMLVETEESNIEEFSFFPILEELYKQGIVTNDILASDYLDRGRIWAYRENITLGISKKIPYKMDVSVRPSLMANFIDEILELNEKIYSTIEFIIFGHVGDGNIHISILKPDTSNIATFQKKCSKIVKDIFEIVSEFEGSISAEHGVGQLKKQYLYYSKSAEEIAYMKNIKLIFDPNNIINPGKIFDLDE